ncbi:MULTISPECIES: helix-turn-helix domain-containing protein [Streptomyces]|nr:XRE family transcriptional regulator [Streptomyces ruber]
MPRWRALPDELDPQVREFAGQLRRVVDRSGLSIAAVADRTGYSKTSWERYLNGRLLAPKGAIVALAEVTGTSPVHLTTMWELAERAWSRSEMRHDMTMEAIRISQARAALGETGPQQTVKGRNGKGRPTPNRGTAPRPGVAGPAGVAPTVSPSVPSQAPAPGGERQPYGHGHAAPPYAAPGAGPGTGGPRGGSWGVAPTASDPTGPSRGTGAHRTSSGPGSAYGAGAGPAGAFGPAADPADAGPGRGGAAGDARRKRRLTMFLAGVGGALVVIGAAYFLTGGGGRSAADGEPSAPASTAGQNADLPAGVKCGGEDCTGKDAEAMGCSGDLVVTSDSVTVGTALVEVRYSETCGTAWARITAAAQGDEVRVSAGGTEQTGAIEAAGDTTAYTPMVAVKDAGEAKACATLQAGQEGCTQ